MCKIIEYNFEINIFKSVKFICETYKLVVVDILRDFNNIKAEILIR